MIYTVTVKPHSKKGPLVLATSSNELTVYLREKPVDGEANQALIKLLAEHFGVAISKPARVDARNLSKLIINPAKPRKHATIKLIGNNSEVKDVRNLKNQWRRS